MTLEEKSLLFSLSMTLCELKTNLDLLSSSIEVVGSIDQMEADDSANAEKNSGPDAKTNSQTPDSDKSKGKRKLYVGSQSLGFRRDHMEVRFYFFIVCYWFVNYRLSGWK